MSVLKASRCEPYCKFANITSYCFDCPAVTCSNCKSAMHEKLQTEDHNILEFKNDNLNWNDKQIILDLFDDKILGENIYCEVSKNLDIENISDVVDSNESYVESWECKKCTISNPKSLKKCKICKYINISDNDFNVKLKKFQLENLEQFKYLDNCQTDNCDINFEYIMQYYTSNYSNTGLITDMVMKYFLNEKSSAIMKKILKENHKISINELEEKYTNSVQEENKNLTELISNTTDQIHLEETSGLLEPENINKNNKAPELSLDRITEKEVWHIILNKSLDIPRNIRIVMVELDLDSHLTVEMLKCFIEDPNLGDYLRQSSDSDNVNLSHLKQAICEQVTIDDALFFLKKCCGLCYDDFPLPEMRHLIICQHEFCKSCIFKWLKEKVKGSYPSNWMCPSCDSVTYNEVDKTDHYIYLRSILSEVSEGKMLLQMFDEKLLEKGLKKSNNFHYCPTEGCIYGFESEGQIKIQCPLCKSFLCANCGKKWFDEHGGKTCEEYEIWMQENDTNLSQLLQNIGIECPKCKTKYAVAAGGCLHFECKHCRSSFCEGCGQLLVKKCDKPNCEMTNFHGHHPRNCIYFLRDRDVNVLEEMLKNSNYPKVQGKPEKQCQFVVTTEDMKDIPCNKEVCQTTGFCEIHYKAYLIRFINRYKIDPADFADIDALNQMLFQLVLPKLNKLATENDNQFKERLIKVVKETCLFYIPKAIYPV